MLFLAAISANVHLLGYSHQVHTSLGYVGDLSYLFSILELKFPRMNKGFIFGILDIENSSYFEYFNFFIFY